MKADGLEETYQDRQNHKLEQSLTSAGKNGMAISNKTIK